MSVNYKAEGVFTIEPNIDKEIATDESISNVCSVISGISLIPSQVNSLTSSFIMLITLFNYYHSHKKKRTYIVRRPVMMHKEHGH